MAWPREFPSRAGAAQKTSKAPHRQSIGWLHLSDLHQGMDGQRVLWPRVRKEFYDDLRWLHQRAGPWELVLFTGDLTQSGAEREFAALDETLERLWELLRELQAEEPVLFAVPGNHDMVRPSEQRSAAFRALVHLWRRDPVVREEFWANARSDYRAMVERCFAPFVGWRAGWRRRHPLPAGVSCGDGALPGDFAATVEREGARLGVVGLNSAFLQLTDDDWRERLELDPRQLLAACGDDPPAWVERHDTALLLTHHPPEWLHPEARRRFESDLAPAGQFVAHLFGHLHEGGARALALDGAEARRELQAASLFGLERVGEAGESRLHGYAAGRLALARKGGRLRLWPRRMERSRNGKLQMVQDTGWDLDRESQSVTLAFAAPRRRAIARDGGAPLPLGERAGGEVRRAPRELQAPGDPYAAEWYVDRPVEREAALAHLRGSRKPVVICGPERSGKTWLLRRVLDELRAAGGCTVVEANLEELDERALDSIDELLADLASRLSEAAGLERARVEAALARPGGCKSKLTRLVEEHVLPSLPGRLVLAVERADAAWGRGAGDDFFLLLRSWAERSEQAPQWSRLRLVLTSSIEPTHLIRKPRPSPFNVARTIRLPELDDGQLAELARLHGIALSPVDVALVRGEVGGDPYLARLALHEAAIARRPLGEVLRAGAVWSERRRELRSLLMQTPWQGALPDGDRRGRPGTLLDALGAVLADPGYRLDLEASLRLQAAGLLVERELGVHLPRNRLYRAIGEALCRAR